MQVERIQTAGKIFVPEKKEKLVKQIKKTETLSAVDSESGSQNGGSRDQEESVKPQKKESPSTENGTPRVKPRDTEGLNVTA